MTLREIMQTIADEEWTTIHDFDDKHKLDFWRLEGPYGTISKVYDEKDAIAIQQLPKIVATINRVLDEHKANPNNPCWLDWYSELAELVGRSYNPDITSEEMFLPQCKLFHQCMTAGKEYKTP